MLAWMCTFGMLCIVDIVAVAVEHQSPLALALDALASYTALTGVATPIYRDSKL